MERVLRVTDLSHRVFNVVETFFIPIDIITPTANGRETDICIYLSQMESKLTYLLLLCHRGTVPGSFSVHQWYRSPFDKSVHNAIACIPKEATGGIGSSSAISYIIFTFNLLLSYMTIA